MDRRAAATRALASLEGLSVGDAFGERFFVGDDGRARDLISRRVLPDGPWRWTDDTAMAVSIVDELLGDGSIDPGRLARRFARRYAAEPARGYGRGTHEALGAIAGGMRWERANRLKFADGSRGNGAAMRSAPIGAWFAGDPGAIAEMARVSSLPTHAHPDAIDGAIAVALAAGWAATPGRSAGRGALLAHVVAHLSPGVVRDVVVRAMEIPDATPEAAAAILGSGQRVLAQDTVPFALWCADRHLDAHAEALWATVAGLGDRDTTCAIVGGILGASLDGAGVPAAWLDRREPLPAR